VLQKRFHGCKILPNTDRWFLSILTDRILKVKGRHSTLYTFSSSGGRGSCRGEGGRMIGALVICRGVEPSGGSGSATRAGLPSGKGSI
jgi:hypothetical protein